MKVKTLKNPPHILAIDLGMKVKTLKNHSHVWL